MGDSDRVVIEVRPFEPADAEPVSQLIATTMRCSNARDYPLTRLEPLIAYFTPAKLRQLAAERHCLVALAGGRVIGTAALDGDQLATFFVTPEHQRRGVGTRLLATLEGIAQSRGLASIYVAASVTGATFYERRGYGRTGAIHDGTAGPQVGLAKWFRAPAG